MTEQTLQPSTYHNAATFPSQPEDYFRAVVGTVSSHIQSGWHGVDASLQIGWAGQVVSLRLGVGLDTDVNGAPLYETDEIDIARADLEHLYAEVTAFYTAAKAALDEIPAASEPAAA